MSTAYLLIGSNLGDRLRELKNAGDLLHRNAGRIVCCSRVYETEAWGREGLPAHLNQALELETSLDPLALLQCIQQIERDMGRIRDEKWGIRLIDIDILFFDDLILRHPQLQIPHPLLSRRRFALTPLVEIAAAYQHPVLHQSTVELLAACDDPLWARPVI